MTQYVLVHGAWHGAWAWDRVAPALRERGHHVVAPTLPDRPDTTLDDHVATVRDAIERAPYPVTVVAHSYAGIVATQAIAAVAPDRVEGAVMVDAWLADPGRSLLDVAPEWFGDWCRDSAVGSGDRAVLPPPPASTLGLEDPALVEHVEARMTAHPLRTFTDPVVLGLDRPGLAKHAIACVPSMFPFAQLARDHGYVVHEIESDHEVMLSHPDQLLDVLESLTGRRPGSPATRTTPAPGASGR